jgi:hypothetical protein
MSLKTKGTQIWVEQTTTDGPVWLQIGCPTGITGLGGAKSQVDDTCLDSEEMEYSPGMAAPGALSVNLNFDPAVTSHIELWELFENDATVRFAIGLSDGAKTIVPTFDTSGAPVYPTTRTFVQFSGYVADFPLDFAVNSNVTSAVSVQRTGPRLLFRKA